MKTFIKSLLPVLLLATSTYCLQAAQAPHAEDEQQIAFEQIKKLMHKVSIEEIKDKKSLLQKYQLGVLKKNRFSLRRNSYSPTNESLYEFFKTFARAQQNNKNLTIKDKNIKDLALRKYFTNTNVHIVSNALVNSGLLKAEKGIRTKREPTAIEEWEEKIRNLVTSRLDESLIDCNKKELELFNLDPMGYLMGKKKINYYEFLQACIGNRNISLVRAWFTKENYIKLEEWIHSKNFANTSSVIVSEPFQASKNDPTFNGSENDGKSDGQAAPGMHSSNDERDKENASGDDKPSNSHDSTDGDTSFYSLSNLVETQNNDNPDSNKSNLADPNIFSDSKNDGKSDGQAASDLEVTVALDNKISNDNDLMDSEIPSGYLLLETQNNDNPDSNKSNSSGINIFSDSENDGKSDGQGASGNNDFNISSKPTINYVLNNSCGNAEIHSEYSNDITSFVQSHDNFDVFLGSFRSHTAPLDSVTNLGQVRGPDNERPASMPSLSQRGAENEYYTEKTNSSLNSNDLVEFQNDHNFGSNKSNLADLNTFSSDMQVVSGMNLSSDFNIFSKTLLSNRLFSGKTINTKIHNASSEDGAHLAHRQKGNISGAQHLTHKHISGVYSHDPYECLNDTTPFLKGTTQSGFDLLNPYGIGTSSEHLHGRSMRPMGLVTASRGLVNNFRRYMVGQVNPDNERPASMLSPPPHEYFNDTTFFAQSHDNKVPSLGHDGTSFKVRYGIHCSTNSTDEQGGFPSPTPEPQVGLYDVPQGSRNSADEQDGVAKNKLSWPISAVVLIASFHITKRIGSSYRVPSAPQGGVVDNVLVTCRTAGE